MKLCKVPGCNQKHRAKGYCSRCYSIRRSGYRLGCPTIFDKRPAIIEGDIAKIPLGVGAKDGYAIVDKEFAWLDKYNRNVAGCSAYPNCRINKKTYKMHRLVCPDKDGFVIDHINRNRTDNRLCNLRYVTKSGNALNTGLSRANTTGYRGISFCRFANKYHVYLGIGGKRINIGWFDNIEKAIFSRNEVYKLYNIEPPEQIVHFELPFNNEVQEEPAQEEVTE